MNWVHVWEAVIGMEIALFVRAVIKLALAGMLLILSKPKEEK